jgi:hypothetical protein
MNAHEYLSKAIELATAQGFDTKANAALVESLFNIARIIDEPVTVCYVSKNSLNIARYEQVVAKKLGLGSIDLHIKKAA